MGVGLFARLQHTPGIRQWDPRAENWVPIYASIWDQNLRLGQGTFARIDAVWKEAEDRTDFIWAAVEAGA
jgi:hypothetical protein